MPFNIDAFSAELKTSGISLTSNFEVQITGSILNKLGGTYDLSSSFSFRIESTNLPQRSASLITNSHYGPISKFGSTLIYADLDMSMICSTDLREREFFMKWQDLFGGKHREGNLDADQRRRQFNIGYYDEYVAKKGVSIYKLDQAGFKVYAVDLIDAFPLNVSPLELSWNQSEAQRMTVTFAYRYFEERNKEDFGTQYIIGKDGIQLSNGVNIPFSKDGIKNQLRNR
jgi:hypothetical protein